MREFGKTLTKQTFFTNHAFVKGITPWTSVAFVVGVYFAIVASLPLGSAFQFGEDEGFEVIKPFLCYKGFRLYSEIWNDQPPVYTKVLALGFKALTPTILTARLIAATYGLLLLISFYELVRRRSGPWVATVATLLLLTSPSVLVLSVSVMLEAAAIGTALVSGWLLFIWGKKRQTAWLVASGSLMAVAMQTKMTAAVVGSAIAAEFFLLCRSANGGSWLRNTAKSASAWMGGFLLVFLLVGLTWARGSLQTSWESHTGEQVVQGFGRPADYSFEPRLLSDHLECVIAAPIALIFALRRKRVRELAFPLTLLMTVCVIHWIHRPWWNYYYIHIAIPLAWLAGWILSEVIRSVFDSRAPEKKRKRTGRHIWRSIALCALAAIAIAKAERRLEAVVKDLRSRQKTADNPIVQQLRDRRAESKWVYSESGMYPFHAQLMVPPELAIIMPKRFWSGQITTGKIIAFCNRDRIQHVIVPMTAVDAEFQVFLEREYRLATNDFSSVLYSRRLSGKENR